jgi:hypothetical protein
MTYHQPGSNLPLEHAAPSRRGCGVMRASCFNHPALALSGRGDHTAMMALSSPSGTPGRAGQAVYESAASRPRSSPVIPARPVSPGQGRCKGTGRDDKGYRVVTVTGHDPCDGTLSALRGYVDDLGAWLAIWEGRRQPDAHARRCLNDAMDAIDAALRELHALRSRLAGEIRDSDDATAARADALLARAHEDRGR